MRSVFLLSSGQWSLQEYTHSGIWISRPGKSNPKLHSKAFPLLSDPSDPLTSPSSSVSYMFPELPSFQNYTKCVYRRKEGIVTILKKITALLGRQYLQTTYDQVPNDALQILSVRVSR